MGKKLSTKKSKRYTNSKKRKKEMQVADDQISVDFIDEEITMEDVVDELKQIKNTLKKETEDEAEITQKELDDAKVEDVKELEEMLDNADAVASETAQDIEEIKDFAGDIENITGEEVQIDELVDELIDEIGTKKILKRALKEMKLHRIKTKNYDAGLNEDMIVGAIVEELQDLVSQKTAKLETEEKENTDENEEEKEQDDDIETVDNLENLEEKAIPLRGRKSTSPLGKRRNHLDIVNSRRSEYGKTSRVLSKSLNSKQVAEMLPTFITDVFLHGNGNIEKAIHFRKNRDAKGIKNVSEVRNINKYYKSMNTSNNAEGGFLVAPMYAKELIKYVYAATALDNFRYTTVDMQHGNITIPKQLSGATSRFVGERRPGKASMLEVGTIYLQAKTLLASLLTTKDLIRMSSFNLETNFFEDLVSALAEGAERGIIAGTGGESMPQGILTHKDVVKIDANKITTDAPEFLDSKGFINGDFITFLKTVLTRTKVASNPDIGFMVDSNIWRVLYDQKTEDSGFYINRDEMKDGKLAGVKIVEAPLLTDYTKENTGSIIFGDWRQLILGETTKLDTQTYKEGIVEDAYGNDINLIKERSWMTEVEYQFDSNLGRGENMIVVENLKVSNIGDALLKKSLRGIK